MKIKKSVKFILGGSGFLSLLSVSAFIALIDLLFKENIDSEPAENFPRELPGSKGSVSVFQKRNDGFAMGFLKERGEVVKFFPAVVSAVLLGRLQAISGMKGRCLEKAGLAVALGGAASNLTDRFRKGYVVDYICINKGALKKIVVNIGDIAIALGALLFSVGSLIESFRKN